MTAKRDKKDEPKAAKRPKLKKETLKDLETPNDLAGEARGGRPGMDNETYTCRTHCGCLSL